MKTMLKLIGNLDRKQKTTIGLPAVLLLFYFIFQEWEILFTTRYTIMILMLAITIDSAIKTVIILKGEDSPAILKRLLSRSRFYKKEARSYIKTVNYHWTRNNVLVLFCTSFYLFVGIPIVSKIFPQRDGLLIYIIAVVWEISIMLFFYSLYLFGITELKHRD